MTDENPKQLSEETVKDKIKEHSKALEQLTAQGRKIQTKRQELTNQMNQIIAQSNELVGAIKGLQGLVKDDG